MFPTARVAQCGESGTDVRAALRRACDLVAHLEKLSDSRDHRNTLKGRSARRADYELRMASDPEATSSAKHDLEPPVILVNKNDDPVGKAGKLAAHQPPGLLHRAVSVFLFSPAGALLIQRRSPAKYHFGGLWANSACTHPRIGESLFEAGRRALIDELGLSTELDEVGSFRYRAVDPGSGLVEHELDHVLVGVHKGPPVPDPVEVDDWSWRYVDDLREQLAAHVDRYAPWLVEALRSFPDLAPT